MNNLLNSNTLKDCRLDVLSSLQKLVDVLHCKTEDCIFKIRIDNNNTDEDVNNFLKCVQNKIGNQGQQSFLSYFVDEFICNVQQHANVQIAYGFAYFEQKSNHLFLGIADGGITIYGSYVASQKYLEKIGNNEEQSLYLAQKGYSTKNLPGAENRGYGVSSNAKIVVDGLSGAFAMVSGNALSFLDINENVFYKLPYDIEWPGTFILAEIPITNQTVDLYKYIS